VSCRHTRYTDIATHCYSGSVAGPRGEENRAAHGNVCVTYECRDCGARAVANKNGRHVEWGAWGPSRAERERAALEAEYHEAQLCEQRPKPIKLLTNDGREVDVSIDGEGYLIVRGECDHPSGEVIQQVAPQFSEYARKLRLACKRAAELRAEV
jgi:hypothetical protein